MPDAIIDTPPAPPANGAPPVIAQPWFKGWVRDDGTLDNTALERLPAHLSPLRETWGRQKTIDDIGVTTAHFQTLAAKKALAPLAADAPEAARLERKAHLDSLNGVPKEAKEYGLTRPESVPERAWDAAYVDKVAGWAHKHSVPPTAMKELLNDVVATQVKGQLESQANAESAFWNEQQQNFDAIIKRENISSEKAAGLVEKGAIALGLDMTSDRTKVLLKGTDARLMALRHAIAIGEDSFVKGDAPDQPDRDPFKVAKDIQNNPANPEYAVYHNREGKYTRSQQDAVIAKVNESYRLATAKKKP